MTMRTDPLHELRRYGEDLVASVPAWETADAVATALRSAPAPRRSSRLAVVLATAACLAVVGTGGSVLADSAVPGDLHYPIDLTFERIARAVGLGSDPAAERLDEAGVLVERSDLPGALDLVAAALDAPDLAVAADELRTAAAVEPALAGQLAQLVAAGEDILAAGGSGDQESIQAARAAFAVVAGNVTESVAASTDEATSPPTTPAQGESRGNQGTQGNPDQAEENPGQSEDNQGNQGQGEQNPGNQGQAEDNSGDQGQAEGNPGNQGQAEGNSGNQGQTEGNQGNQGQGEENPGNQGNQGNQGEGQGSPSQGQGQGNQGQGEGQGSQPQGPSQGKGQGKGQGGGG